VPVGRRSIDRPGEVAEQAFGRLASATGVTVAGAGVATREALPAAADEARRALRIATACGRSGAVLAGQLLVERAITGSGPAVRELAGLIGSLAPWPHLPATLAALYQHDLDRSATADHLHIARRTLTKRLDRIHQLTGIRPTSAHGVQTFLTALAADRLAVPAPVSASAPVRAC
jgi:sugar diacid utilization regulator